MYAPTPIFGVKMETRGDEQTLDFVRTHVLGHRPQEPNEEAHYTRPSLFASIERISYG